mmetsp:Transcript_41604/g.102523  ORF Transcript_41604/g.102523 Transcript_41604/m.102523 type:complete len:648 (-) Transcript_41604:191-2134(-)
MQRVLHHCVLHHAACVALLVRRCDLAAAVVDEGEGEQREGEEHHEEAHQVPQAVPLVQVIQVELLQHGDAVLAHGRHVALPLPLVHHERTPRVLHQVDVRVPLPVHRGVGGADQEPGEEQQGHHVGGQQGVGRLHVGGQGGDEVGQHHAVAQREVVHEPEHEEGALEVHGVEHDAGDDEGHEGEQHHLVEHLGQQVRDGLVQPVRPLAHVQRPLHDDLRHVGRGAKRRQRGPHEEHCADVDHVLGRRLVADAPVQREDEDGQKHLVAQTRTQELAVGVVLAGAVLDHDPEGPPAGRGGGVGGRQLPRRLLIRLHLARPRHRHQHRVALLLEAGQHVHLVVRLGVTPAVASGEHVDEPLDVAVAVALGLDARQRGLRVRHERRAVGAEVHLHAAAQDHGVVEQAEGVRRGGVDGGDDGGVVGHQALHHAHHLVRCERVQPAGGLVQEQHGRVGDERDGDVGALLLPAADALDHLAAHHDVPRLPQPQLLDQLVHLLLLVREELLPGALELRRVQQHLTHREGGDQGVELFDVAGVAAHELGVGHHAAEQQRAGGGAHALAAREHVQKGGLAGARGPQQRRHLARVEHRAHLVQQPRLNLGILEAGHAVRQVLGGDAHARRVHVQVAERCDLNHTAAARGSPPCFLNVS